MNDDPEDEIKQEETGAAEPELLYSDAHLVRGLPVLRVSA